MESSEERRTLLGNCRRLKNLEQFKGISIRKDLTVQQQTEFQHIYSTRAATRANKRKANSEEREEPSQKRISNDPESME